MISEESEFSSLLSDVRALIMAARRAVAATVNHLQVRTCYEIGRRIVEQEQKGAGRATYGKQVIKTLSATLTEEFGRGFSVTNLKLMRQFFLQNRELMGQSATDSSAAPPIGQSPTDQLTGLRGIGEGQDSLKPLTLSWTHHVCLLGIDNREERRFYEIEAAHEGWSVKELKRQLASGLYERLALSRNKEGVRRLAQEGLTISRPEDLLKQPYVLEFLGIEERASFSETDLEQAIIERIERFLLELGKGFLFEARQKRFTFGEDHFYVDLVFYNRLLRCFVLIDLKLDKVTHQDLGQMQMYVNYYDRHVRAAEERPTIGILLCRRKNAGHFRKH